MPANRTILILGKRGQIGWELCKTCSILGTVVAVDYPEIDFEQPDSICKFIRSVRPAIIINAAAYTEVDRAELEPDKAMAINGRAPGVIAEEAMRLRTSLLIHYSTDYVYDGASSEPYVEADIPNPLNMYGRSKLAGDQAIAAVGCPHLILRTSWVYGWRGKNFLMTMLKLARERDEIRIVDDQIGTPNWASDLAKASALVASRYLEGFQGSSSLYHLSASGKVSWYGFAKSIFQANPDASSICCKRLLRVSSVEYRARACRPSFSVLDSSKLMTDFGIRMPFWRDPLEQWAQGDLESSVALLMGK